ncbi:hypothetical protein, partial [Marinimicrobium alkaliphilum]|uniref:hypothetical protein n=1 Tax=Marinimicrobium alkaliphilum TaxID=2202654 RepID=UPI001E32D3BD
ALELQSMSKFLKYLWYAFVAIIAIFGVMFIVVIFLGGAATSCGEDSESVAYARGMPDERLARLYYDMERFSLDSASLYSELKADSEGVFPEPFSDIKAVRVRPKQGSITLNGCFDHYVHLSFHGFESNKEFYPKRQIVLRWGEHDGAGSEVIWSE